MKKKMETGLSVYGYPEVTKYNFKLLYDFNKEAMKDNLKERRKYFTQQLLQGADGALWVVLQQHGAPDCFRLDAINVESTLFSSLEEESDWNVLCISLYHRGEYRKIFLDEMRIDENGYVSRAFKRASVNFAMKAKTVVEGLVLNWARDAAVLKKIPEHRGWYFDGICWDYAENDDDTVRGIQRWL